MLVALTGAAAAGPWEDAFRGDAAAQLKVGDMYASGDGVPHDYGEPVKWYRLAADQGYAGAQSALGNMYANGRTSLLAGFGFAWFTTMVDKEHPGPFTLIVFVVTALTIFVLLLASIIGALLTIARSAVVRPFGFWRPGAEYFVSHHHRVATAAGYVSRP
jgi:hypothetical protein